MYYYNRFLSFCERVKKKIVNIFFNHLEFFNREILDKKINSHFYFTTEQRISFFDYSDRIVKQAIWNLKFKANYSIIDFWAEIIYENIFDILTDLEISENFYQPIIIHIPATRLSKFKRGYNQNELVIKKLLKKLPKNYLIWEKNNLIKIKNNKKQSKIKNREERILNIKNAFKIKYPEKIKNKNILLFDDIMTTGATLNEAKKVLKKAGAKKIIFMTLAH